MTAERMGGSGLGLAVAWFLLGGHDAAADGERTPMFGLAAVGGEATRGADQATGFAGLELDLAWSYGRLGLAAEAAARWSIGQDAQAFVLGGSLRLRVLDGMVPALMDTRQVEVGLELQAIVEREWWSASGFAVEPMSHGVGIAIRGRGATEPEGESVLVESRFFVRVMTSRGAGADVIARATMPSTSSPPALTVVIGIGAAFGSGTTSYMQRFRSRPSGPTLMW